MEITIMYICAFILLSFIFTIKISSQYDEENGEHNEPSRAQKYRPYFYSMQLPMCLGILLIIDWCFYDSKHAAHAFLSSCFAVFLSIGIYFVILLCLLPLLRKYISARSCAFLWLIPNYLYIMILYLNKWEKPIAIFHAPGNLIGWILGIWFLGFFSVMIWNIFSHMRYRKSILENAVPVTDQEIIAIWQKEIEVARLQNAPRDVMISPSISTPMTIGLFKGSMKMVLPKKYYSADDLALIFRHELIHIGREDNWSKFFLIFCTAMCWFNPFMWIAVKKCAEDLELSCDEMVLIYADQSLKQRYAELILKTAGNERGFTTCLSVKAKSLHYRLKNILNSKERSSGIFLIGVISFLLMFTCGHVALAYGDTTGKEIIFENEDIDNFVLANVYDYSAENANADTKRVLCTNEKALLHYLETLTISEITGDYFFGELEYKINISLESSNKEISLSFSDEVLKMSVFELFTEGDFTEYAYYLPEGVDWDIIYSYISDYPILDLIIECANESSAYCHPTIQTIRERDGEKRIVFQNDLPLEDVATVTGYRPPYTAEAYFSEKVVSDFYIDVEKLDGSESCTLTPKNLADSNIGFPVDPEYYPAKFTVHATFENYEAEYQFIVE